MPRGVFKGHLDFKRYASNLSELTANLTARKIIGVDVNLLERAFHDVQRLRYELGLLNKEKNILAKNAKQGPVDKEAGRRAREEADRKAAELSAAEETLSDVTLRCPNWTDPQAPRGPEAVEVRTFNEKPTYPFPPLPHDELLEKLGLVDFESGRKAAGARGYFLKGSAVALHHAMISHAIRVAESHGFQPCLAPSLVRKECAEGCGFTPRDTDVRTRDMYDVDEEHCLSATAEIPLAAAHSMSQLSVSSLPLRVCGVSQCFRPEAGNSGRHARGLYRVHEFSKVELFVVCHPEESASMLESLVNVQKCIIQPLGLHCRVLDMPPCELGAAAARKYDIEAFWPARAEPWGELTSASNCTDFQARRLNVKYCVKDGLHFAHTLNATAMALPRTLAALVEHHQCADGNVRVPEVLVPLMGGRTFLK